MAKEAYKDHRAGSSKGAVHKVFDTSGKDAALKKAAALGLAESTARTWCSTWAKGGTKKAKPAKAAKPVKAAKAKGAKKAAAKKPAKRPARKAAPAENHAAA